MTVVERASLAEVAPGEPVDLPVDLEHLLGAKDREALRQQLERIARTRREVQVEAASLRLG